MASARDWPTRAEHERQEAIALFLAIQTLMVQAFRAMRDGDQLKAAELMNEARIKARRGQERLRMARSEAEPLDEELEDALDLFLSDQW